MYVLLYYYTRSRFRFYIIRFLSDNTNVKKFIFVYFLYMSTLYKYFPECFLFFALESLLILICKYLCVIKFKVIRSLTIQYKYIYNYIFSRYIKYVTCTNKYNIRRRLLNKYFSYIFLAFWIHGRKEIAYYLCFIQNN